MEDLGSTVIQSIDSVPYLSLLEEVVWLEVDRRTVSLSNSVALTEVPPDSSFITGMRNDNSCLSTGIQLSFHFAD
jgi:hypothetical protein